MSLGKYFELKRKFVCLEFILDIVTLLMTALFVYLTSPGRQINLEANELVGCIGNSYYYMFDLKIFSFPDLLFGISAVFALVFSIMFLLQQKKFGLQHNGTYMCFHIFSVVYFMSVLLTDVTYLPIVYIFIEFYYLRLLCQDIEAKTKLLPGCFGAAVFTELLRCILLIFYMGCGMDTVVALDAFGGLIIFYYICKVITGVLQYQFCGALAHHKKPVHL